MWPGRRRTALSPPSAPSLGHDAQDTGLGILVVRRRTIQSLSGSCTLATRSSPAPHAALPRRPHSQPSIRPAAGLVAPILVAPDWIAGPLRLRVGPWRARFAWDQAVGVLTILHVFKPTRAKVRSHRHRLVHHSPGVAWRRHRRNRAARRRPGGCRPGALFLNVRHRILGDTEIFRGTLHRADVEPRQILKECLLRGAAGVVIFHTHPSGRSDTERRRHAVHATDGRCRGVGRRRPGRPSRARGQSGAGCRSKRREDGDARGTQPLAGRPRATVVRRTGEETMTSVWRPNFRGPIPAILGGP